MLPCICNKQIIFMAVKIYNFKMKIRDIFLVLLNIVVTHLNRINDSTYEPHHEKITFFICKNKDADQLISAFVFATYIVQSLFFLNPKFQTSSHLL